MCYASCAVEEVGQLVAVHIGWLTVVAQRVAEVHSTGRMWDEWGMISSDGTASGGPVQQQKLRRTRVSMQASRNPPAGMARGV